MGERLQNLSSSCCCFKGSLDCLQSAFCLKIRLVLILASAIENHDVTLQHGIGKRRYIFFLGMSPRLSRHECACVSLAVTLQRKIRVCSQSKVRILLR